MRNLVYVVGIGPGGPEGMTEQAKNAIEASDIICGYKVYIDLVKPIYPEKPIISTGMMQEVERCRQALTSASEGKTVAVVCSGDPGIYGMGGLIYQLLPEFETEIDVEIIPGVSAAMSGAAVLGAPLMHDFAVISLSDLLTTWDVIEKRIEGASMGDLAICLYNPGSKKRSGHLKRACEIMLKHKSPDTVCGWVRNIGRNGQECKTLTLAQLADYEADMFTTVFIGNAATYLYKGKMITARGYEKKRI